MLGCEGLICKGEEQSEKRGYFKGAAICQSEQREIIQGVGWELKVWTSKLC